jgi:hypothetical protein
LKIKYVSGEPHWRLRVWNHCRFQIADFQLISLGQFKLMAAKPIGNRQLKIGNASDPLNLIRLTPSKGETATRDRSILF